MLKCPFHGKIVERDDKGNPLNPLELETQERPLKQPWELLEDQVNQQLFGEERKRKESRQSRLLKTSKKLKNASD